jgi:hypothetical protein
MNLLDIIYTPLDTPNVPNIDIQKLRRWIESNYVNQHVPGRLDSSKITDSNTYPWTTVYPLINYKWQANFDELFPEFVDFICQAFLVEKTDLLNILLLPLKRDHVGAKFWHADPDVNGLRFYIENPDHEDFLFIKPTKIPYDDHKIANLVSFRWEQIQDVTYSAKMLKPDQCFYLNNTRSIHVVNSHKVNSKRIAVLVILDKKIEKISKLNELIIDSALKFSDHSIIWKPE